MELNVSAVRDRSGAYIGNVLEWANVTEARRQASLLQAIGETQVVLELDLEGNVVNAHPEARRVLDFAAGPNSMTTLFSPGGEGKDQSACWTAIRDGQSADCEAEARASDGSLRQFRIHLAPVADRKGKPFGAIALGTDVTAQKRAEARREEEEARRRAEGETVLRAVSGGLARLSRSDFDCAITEPFAPVFEPLRTDFNGAVEVMRAAAAETWLAADSQDHVVRSLAEGLKRLTEGDLTVSLTEPFAGDNDRLRTDFNATVERLHNVITALIDVARAVERGAAEVSGSNSDLSERTDRQAATLENTASATEQIAATADESARRAKGVNTTVTAVQGDAEKAHTIVRDAITAMAAVEGSSSEISKIIGLIDDIAFQTNLLALNAGVEAARAGHAGRGFAVVAQEVRGLAQRTAEAAKEISDLIVQTSGQVDEGATRVRSAGDALSQIVERIATASTLASQIASSASEQSQTIATVSKDVRGLDEVTQKNAVVVQKTAAASDSLNSSARELGRLVETFTTRKAGAKAGAPRGAWTAAARAAQPEIRSKGAGHA